MEGAENQAKVINDAVLRISVTTVDASDAAWPRFRQIEHAVHQKTSPSSVRRPSTTRGRRKLLFFLFIRQGGKTFPDLL